MEYAPLHGLDDVPWAQLRHAYGKASDLPRRLRALATNWRMREQLDGIEGALFPLDNGICSASAAAVPFLVELATTPKIRIRADIVELLGRLVMRLNARGPSPDGAALREVLLSLHDRLIALAKDRNAKVRKEAVALLWQYAAMSPRADEIEQALLARDARERELAVRVRSRIEGALADRAVVLRLTVATDEPLRLANLLARRILDRESVPAQELVAAALAPTVPREAYAAWGGHGRWLVQALSVGCEDVAARMEIVRPLLVHGSGEVLAGAVHAAADAMAKSRSATKSVVPLLANLLYDDDPAIRAAAAELVAAVGEAGIPYADRLARLLGDGDRAVEEAAALALVRQGDERAVPIVLRAVKENGGRHLGDMAKACAPRYPERVVPVLHAALERCGPEPTPLQHDFWLALAACGPAGFGAEDALLLMLASKDPTPALMVFEAAGVAAAHLGPWIEALAGIVEDRWLALWAAHVHCAVTGDRTLLREALAVDVQDWRFACRFVRSAALLDPIERPPIVARAVKWLRSNKNRWDMPGMPTVAVASGDIDLALDVLARALASPPYLEALRAVAELGPAVRALKPQVLALLDRDDRVADSVVLDDQIQAAALEALAAIGPA